MINFPSRCTQLNILSSLKILSKFSPPAGKNFLPNTHSSSCFRRVHSLHYTDIAPGSTLASTTRILLHFAAHLCTYLALYTYPSHQHCHHHNHRFYLISIPFRVPSAVFASPFPPNLSLFYPSKLLFLLLP